MGASSKLVSRGSVRVDEQLWSVVGERRSSRVFDSALCGFGREM